MKDIKGVRQALEDLIYWTCKGCNKNCEECFIKVNLKATLDQFITDTELLINDLNDAKTIIADYKKENKKLKKQLAITDKALDKIAQFLYHYRINHNLYHRNKDFEDEWKHYSWEDIKEKFIRESENANETN